MSSLELKIPPPIVALLFALFMWLAAFAVDPLGVSFGIRVGVAIALGLAGVALSAAGIVAFRRAKTTVNPHRPAAASSLVSAGVYRITRNPMYLGLVLALLGWAVFLASAPALLLVAVFMLYMNRFQIQPEERALRSLFGGEYTAYTERVRRWL